jgi:hypothetical protein
MDAGQPRRLDQLGVKLNAESLGSRLSILGTSSSRVSRRHVRWTLTKQFRMESHRYDKGGHGVNPDQSR